MNGAALERLFREASGRIIGALASRFRDLSLAEDACAEAFARAVDQWPATGMPDDPSAWLYRVAFRIALDAKRRRKTEERFAYLHEDAGDRASESIAAPDEEPAEIPDERLRLIFICCHPAVSADARAALTLRLVCGLSTQEIARAFLVPETTLAQRLTRAKSKIAEAGVPFEVPAPEHWAERTDAVLSTVEIAYAKAHEDSAGAGPHASYASEMLALSRMVAQLIPEETDTLALAATIHFAEARRPARIDPTGGMVPLSEQDPTRWDRTLIEAGHQYLARALRLASHRRRVFQARIHGEWCRRRNLAEPAPWAAVLALYDEWLELDDSPLVRLNRAIALSEIRGPAAALAEIEKLDAERLRDYAPFHAARADLLRRVGDNSAARAAYERAVELVTTAAERHWLSHQLARLADGQAAPCASIGTRL